MNRTKNSIRNAAFTIAGSLLVTLFQLINRKVFVLYLSNDYLGLNGLFYNILSIVSMSEMGIGTAMIFALYKPVADKDIEKIKSLMNLYKRLYTAIGFFVLILGLALTPFLNIFIKDMPDIPHIYLYYVMYVIDSGMSYFYTYKRSLVICNQEDYISSTTTTLSSVGARLVQLIILATTHNYFLFLLVQILFTRLENVLISKIADKKYPYLRDKEVLPLDETDAKNIKKNILAMVTQKIGSVFVSGTDNLIISKMLGLAVVGLYSNYNLLMNTVNSLITKVFNSVTASIGNLIVKKSKEESEKVFYCILFANYWIFNFVTVCFCSLLQPFICLWLGEKFLLSTYAVWIFVLVFYFNGMRKTVLEFRNATGIFWFDRYRALVEAAVNLVFSIPLTFLYGVMGVKLGSLIALLTTTFWLEGHVLYKNFFRKSSWVYQFVQLKYACLTILQCGLVSTVCKMVDNGSVLSFLVECFVAAILPNLILFLLFGRTKEFIYFLNVLKHVITERGKKE